MVNGILAAPLMTMMMLIVTNPRAMGRVRISPAQKIGGWLATATMAIATLIFFATLVVG